MKGLKRKILSESKTRKLNNKKGMTYVELLCALSLLVLIVVMFSPMLLSSYESLYEAGEKTYTVYGGKKEIEKGLTFRGQHDDLAEGMEVNFKTFSTVVLIKAKQVVTSMSGLETLYSDEKGLITVPADLTMADNQDTQILKIKFSNSSVTEEDFVNGKVFITNNVPSVPQLRGGKMAYQFKSAFDESKDLSKDAEFVKLPNMDVEDEENYDPKLHVMIKGIDVTDSPIRVRVYYLSGNQVKCSETHYYISPADLMFVGDTGTADYFTSAGVNENGDMLVAARTFQKSSMRVTSGLNDVKWISENNDSSLADGYYMMCGENSVVRRLWHFTPGVLNIGTRSIDFTSLLGAQTHYVFGGDVAYPYEWAGDYTDTYSMSVNTTDSVYENATHNYSLNGSNLAYGFNGYTVNASSLNNGIWAQSENAARNRRISYIMSGSEEEAKVAVGGSLSRDGFLTSSYSRGNFWGTKEDYTNYNKNNGNSGDYEFVFKPNQSEKGGGKWYRRKGTDGAKDYTVNGEYIYGYNMEGSWFDNAEKYDNAMRYVASDHDHTDVKAFNVRNSVPSGMEWGVNETVNASSDKDITCLVLKSYNNYDINHLTNNSYQNATTNQKVNLTSCIALPGKGGESLCLGTTNAYALINTTTPRDPEVSMAGYIKTYKIEGVGNYTYAKTYAQDTSGFDEVAAALQDYAGSYAIDEDKSRQLAQADTSSPSNGGIVYDACFTMGYSSQLIAVYDKFINDNSSHKTKPLESYYLASKGVSSAVDDGYHNMWLTREFYNLTVSDYYKKSVVAAGYNVSGAVKAGYKKTMYAPFNPDNDTYRDEALLNYHTADGIINPPAPGTDSSIWHEGEYKVEGYYGLDFRGKYGYTNNQAFWVQLPMATVTYTDLDRITNDAVLSVYTEGVKTFAPILYYKETNGTSVRFNCVSVSALNDKKVGIAAGTSNGKLFIVYPDYVNGVISSAPISMQDNSKYQMHDYSGSITSIDAVKAFSASVDGSAKFCLVLSGKSVSALAPVIGVAIFDTQSGALEKYTEHLPAGMGDANIKDICVANGIVYAVGCKVSSGTETKNGVIYSCNLDELLSNSAKNDGTSTKWSTVDTCATEVKADNGELVAKSSSILPALKAVASTAELD